MIMSVDLYVCFFPPFFLLSILLSFYHDDAVWMQKVKATMLKIIYILKLVVGGLMLVLLQEFHSTKDYGVQSRHAHDSSSNSVGKPPCCTKFRMKQMSPCLDKLSYGKTTDKLKISQHPNDDATFLSPSPCKKLKGEDSEDSSSLAESYRRKTPAKTSNSTGLFTDDEVSGLLRTQVIGI